jgi:hypothetical protein
MEDLIFDLEYQEYLYEQQRQKNQMWEEFHRIEEEAYDKMCEQAHKEQELYETLMMEKEYRKIEEWEEFTNN